jgi:anti-anti-sigma factor
MDHETQPPAEGSLSTRTVVSGGLKIRIDREDRTCVVRLEGELDMETEPALTQELSRVLLSDLKRVTLDLDGLRFTDSSGLGCLVAATRVSRDNRNTLRIIEPGGQVGRVISLAKLDAVLPLVARPVAA